MQRYPKILYIYRKVELQRDARDMSLIQSFVESALIHTKKVRKEGFELDTPLTLYYPLLKSQEAVDVTKMH